MRLAIERDAHKVGVPEEDCEAERVKEAEAEELLLAREAVPLSELTVLKEASPLRETKMEAEDDADCQGELLLEPPWEGDCE